MLRRRALSQIASRRYPRASLRRRSHKACSSTSKPIVQVVQALGDGNRTHTLFRVSQADGALEKLSTPATQSKAIGTAKGLVATILPAGYPESVKAGYSRYVCWQLSSMTFTSAAGVLSTQALLHAVGLGAGAIPMAAALNWVLKDGLGQLGGIIFSALVNTRFDANPKMWRMAAALSLDCSTALELLSPLFPAYFLPLASIANVGKNVSFLAASASRAAIHNSFVNRENLADITGKAGAQNILSSMGGMGIGIALSAYLGSDYAVIAPAAAVLMCGHLFSTYQSLHTVVLTTIDAQRLDIIAAAALAHSGDDGGAYSGVPDPLSVSKAETILAHIVRDALYGANSPGLVLGTGLDEALGSGGDAVAAAEELRALRDYAARHGDPYLVAVRGTGSSGGQSSSGSSGGRALVGGGDSGGGEACVYLLLMEHCDSDSALRGALHAHAARRLLRSRGYKGLSSSGANSKTATQSMSEVVEESRPVDADKFVAKVKAAGWKTDVLFFEDSRRVRLRFVYAQ